MTDIFLTGAQGPGTNQPPGITPQPALSTVPAIPNYDGTTEGLTATVNTLVDAVRRLSGQVPTKRAPSRQKPNNPKGNKTQQKRNNADQQQRKNDQRFSEVNRTTENVTVSDPVSGATLTYQQITKLVMQDNVTGEQWEWDL